jgi:hypothetical protein
MWQGLKPVFPRRPYAALKRRSSTVVRTVSVNLRINNSVNLRINN